MKQQLNFRIDSDEFNLLKQMAKEKNIKVSKLIRKILYKEIHNYENKNVYIEET